MALLPMPGEMPIRAYLPSLELVSGVVVMKMLSLKPSILHFSTSACENVGTSSKATVSNAHHGVYLINGFIGRNSRWSQFKSGFRCCHSYLYSRIQHLARYQTSTPPIWVSWHSYTQLEKPKFWSIRYRPSIGGCPHGTAPL